MNTPVVKVFTGIRRCGKSVLLELVQAELRRQGIGDQSILALNFESAADSRVRSTESVLQAVNDQLKANRGGRLYLFFDEIQELSSWETLLNSLLVDRDVNIYITGSNARMLAGELATYLAGRYVEIRIYPFSFAEVIELLSQGGQTVKTEDALKHYLLRGSFPFLYNYPFTNADANQYMRDIFDSTVLKDIAQRNAVRDIAQLRQLVLYFIANVGNTFSAGSLVKFLKNQRRSLSTETVYNYIEYCRAACFLHLAQRQDVAGKALLGTQEKIYLADHGIREAIYGNNQRDINQVLENIVYMELIFAPPGARRPYMSKFATCWPATRPSNANSPSWKTWETITPNTFCPWMKSTAAGTASCTKISAISCLANSLSTLKPGTWEQV